MCSRWTNSTQTTAAKGLPGARGTGDHAAYDPAAWNRYRFDLRLRSESFRPSHQAQPCSIPSLPSCSMGGYHWMTNRSRIELRLSLCSYLCLCSAPSRSEAQTVGGQPVQAARCTSSTCVGSCPAHIVADRPEGTEATKDRCLLGLRTQSPQLAASVALASNTPLGRRGQLRGCGHTPSSPKHDG